MKSLFIACGVLANIVRNALVMICLCEAAYLMYLHIQLIWCCSYV